MEQTVTVFFSDGLRMNEELTKERDQLLTTVEDLREKLNKAIATQQEIETQRDAATGNISQVNKWHILIDSRLMGNVFLIVLYFETSGTDTRSSCNPGLREIKILIYTYKTCVLIYFYHITESADAYLRT